MKKSGKNCDSKNRYRFNEQRIGYNGCKLIYYYRKISLDLCT